MWHYIRDNNKYQHHIDKYHFSKYVFHDMKAAGVWNYPGKNHRLDNERKAFKINPGGGKNRIKLPFRIYKERGEEIDKSWQKYCNRSNINISNMTILTIHYTHF